MEVFHHIYLSSYLDMCHNFHSAINECLLLSIYLTYSFYIMTYAEFGSLYTPCCMDFSGHVSLVAFLLSFQLYVHFRDSNI